MLLEFFYDKALAHASYMVGCQKTGEAIVIDPCRNIDEYVDFARREKLSIVGTAETHIHADYVSGSRELAERVGATIFVSDEGPADWKYTYVSNYRHRLLKDGDTFGVGNVRFEVLFTPGHTPESISFLLTDIGGGADRPMGLFTGDFVFVGSTGRPDLLEQAAGVKGSAEPGARSLYQSIQRFRSLPDYLQIWPSHGAGSACGKGLGAVPSSTAGYEKMFNEALQFDTEDAFVKYILQDQPEAPRYFARMKHVNKHGPDLIGDHALPSKMELANLNSTIESHMVIDNRPATMFAQGHVAGSINIPRFLLASQAGWFVNYDKPLYLITSQLELEESVRILREIGVDNISGFFDVDDLLTSGAATDSFPNQTPEELFDQIKCGGMELFDVRRKTEWVAGRIPQAEYHFLGDIPDLAGHLSEEKPIVLQCRTGVRSTIAASILRALGIRNVVNLKGGIEGWENAGLPIDRSTPAEKGCEASKPF